MKSQIPKMMHISAIVFLSITTCISSQVATPAPSEDIVTQPENRTVLEGYPTVMKCVFGTPVHMCKWYYLKTEHDFFRGIGEPQIVKEFKPSRSNDCSIKFKKVKRIQEGQWLCQGLRIISRKYIASRPAFLTVIPREQNTSLSGRNDDFDYSTGDGANGTKEDKDEDFSPTPTKPIYFDISEAGLIRNSQIGNNTTLECHVNSPITKCSWIMPNGLHLVYSEDDPGKKVENPYYASKYQVLANMSEGECLIVVQNAWHDDEGDWKCVVELPGEQSERVGPLIHLHLKEHGEHIPGENVHLLTAQNNASLIGILVSTSIILLVILLLLVFYMYKRSWDSDERKYLHQGQTINNDYSGNPSLDLKSHDSGSNLDFHTLPDTNPLEYGDCNRQTQYLDMTGSGYNGSYVPMSGQSCRSSVSSRTTLSTLPAGRQWPMTIHSTSLPNCSLIRETNLGKPHPYCNDRPYSVYSTGHLYEEIKDGSHQAKPFSENTPGQTVLQEDAEGYILPTSSSNRQQRKLPEIPDIIPDFYNERRKRADGNVSSMHNSHESRPSEFKEDSQRLNTSESALSAMQANQINYDMPKESPVLKCDANVHRRYDCPREGDRVPTTITSPVQGVIV